jgi:hypothetical protein
MSAGQWGHFLVWFGISLASALVGRWIAKRWHASAKVRFYVASVAALLPSLVYFVDGNMELFDAAGVAAALVVPQMWHHSDAKAEEERKRSAAKE